MRWLIIQSDGAHKGQDDWAPNWFLRECYGLQDALLRHGHLADIWGLRHSNFLQTPDFNSYDVIFLAENYEMDWLPDFSTIKKPTKIQWIIDLHCQDWKVYGRITPYMDLTLHATKSLMAPFSAKAGGNHLWWPNAVDDRYFRQYEPVSRTTDLLFIGGKGKDQRGLLLDYMIWNANLTYEYGVTGYGYINAIRKAKIGFNKNAAGDLNYRTFETIALGACLLTEQDPVLIELGFAHGFNCLVYDNQQQAVEQAAKALEAGTWPDLATRGQELATHHTYYYRIKDLLEHL